MQDRSSDRIKALTDFVHQHVDGVTAIEVASADASFRRYFRVAYQDGTLIVMDAPPEKEDVGPFIDIAQRLSAAGLHVPTIVARDVAQGFLLLSDLGSRTMLPELTKDSVDHYYRGAIEAVVAMQQHTACDALPLYDANLLRQEMQLMPTWFLSTHLSHQPTEDEQAMLDDVFTLLVDNAEQQSQRFVHRDYHSRNLMLIDQPQPAIIDFQDAVLGPITYDVVSLLKDCYVQWPREQVLAWLNHYWQVSEQAGLHQASFAQFTRWFDLMGLQRHIKVLGIFARLYHRDGKDGYLNDLPLTWQYVVETAALYPELTAFNEWLTTVVAEKFARTQTTAMAGDTPA